MDQVEGRIRIPSQVLDELIQLKKVVNCSTYDITLLYAKVHCFEKLEQWLREQGKRRYEYGLQFGFIRCDS